MVRFAALALAVFVLGAPGSALADLASAKTKLIRGDYKGAEAELVKIRGKNADAALLELARLQMRTGRYEQAEKSARQVTRSSDSGTAAEGRIFLAEILRFTGRLSEARQLLEPMVKNQPDRLRARWLLALVHQDAGDRRAEPLWQHFRDEFERGAFSIDDADHMFYLAEALRYLREFEDANSGYRQAIDVRPSFHEANLEWGDLFLEKYAPGDAKESYRAVLKIDRRHPDAHAGLAAGALEGSYDVPEASRHIERALAVNPQHRRALLLRAGVEIDQSRWDKAKATLAEVLTVHPRHGEAHALLATIAWLRDDTATFEAEKKAAFELNPRYADFYHIIAKFAVREHRYKEAIELEKQAVAIDPSYYEAMEAIGTGYLRLGQEKEGLDWLRKAWEGDQFNLKTKNTLDLFEEYIPREYSFADSKNFRVRYHNHEKAVYRRHIEPLLETAFADMVSRYGFTPQTPVVVELYQNSDHYSVRTIGLPNLSALGVCFGPVITALSPSVSDINWAMVLWHELGHVFAIQMSNSRVPRWFTEGLSEYETVLARPEWRRENDADVWAAIQDNNLPSIAELNYGFMKPSMQDVVVAYHTSSLAIEFLAQTYGFDKIVEALKLYGKGLETPEVLGKITGVDIATLDAKFRDYLDIRLAPYNGSFHLPTAGMDDMKALTRAAKAAPKDGAAQARLALGHFYQGNGKAAAKLADLALKLDPNNAIAMYVTAEIALRSRDAKTARKRYEEMIQVGADSFDVRARLGTIVAGMGDLDTAEKHFCTAKTLDPERSFPYQALAELYERKGNKEKALRELETFVVIEQMQIAPLRRLVEGYAELGRWDKVQVYGQMAIELTLADADLFMTVARAHAEAGDAKEALYTFDSALLVQPTMRRPALAHIGRAKALTALGDRRGARKAVRQALALEPENKDALILERDLK